MKLTRPPETDWTPDPLKGTCLNKVHPCSLVCLVSYRMCFRFHLNIRFEFINDWSDSMSCSDPVSCSLSTASGSLL